MSKQLTLEDKWKADSKTGVIITPPTKEPEGVKGLRELAKKVAKAKGV